MKLVDFRRAHLLRRSAAFVKGRGHILNRLPLPGADLVRMNAVLLGQFRQRHFLADRIKRYTRLEIRRMVLSLRHLGSSF